MHKDDNLTGSTQIDSYECDLLKMAIDALERADHKAFAACFSEDAWYYDYCPALDGEECWVSYGSIGIEMLLGNRFMQGLFTVVCPVIEDGHRASFFATYSGAYQYAMLDIQEIDSFGLIKKAVVYPA